MSEFNLCCGLDVGGNGYDVLVSCRLASKRYWWVSNITIFEPLSAGLIIMCGCDLS